MSAKKNEKPRLRGKRHKEDKGVFLPVVESAKSKERNAEFPDLVVPHEKFARVRVVLVEPKYSGNIGQVARVLRNFGYGRLAMVRPRCMIDVESEKMAVGAEDLLDAIAVFDSLEEAVAGSRIVIGTTRRRGTQRKNVIDPRLCAELVEPVLEVGEATFVFGPEDSGLSNEELGRCHWLASIPSGSEKSSFNLSHAVGMFLYEVAYRLLMPLPWNYARHEAYEGLFDHLEDFLQDIGFLKPDDEARMMLVVRRLLYRGRYSEREVRILRGIISQAQWRIKNPDVDTSRHKDEEADD